MTATRLAQLDFGVLVGPRTMDVMTSITSQPPQNNLQLILDVPAKRLVVYFVVSSPSPRGSATSNFKFIVNPSQILDSFIITPHQKESYLVISLARPPRYFWNLRGFASRDSWYRATGISQNMDLSMRYPVALCNDVGDASFIDIGRWTTFRLALDKDQTPSGQPSSSWPQLQASLLHLGLSPQHHDDFRLRPGADSIWRHLERPLTAPPDQPLALLDILPSQYIHLDFQLRYQLEVCLSHGLLHENTLTADFLTRLSSLPNRHAVRLLEQLADGGSRLFDPMQLFRLPNHAPPTVLLGAKARSGYCTWVRKAVITPTSIRFSSPSLEMSNRVMREYSHLQNRFLRVQFSEETERGRIPIEEHNDEIWKRVFRTLYHGIRIGHRLYHFLGFGNSQLRIHSAYFFCPTEHTSADDIRKWMGDLDHIRVVAKYAARMGQCFTTTKRLHYVAQPRQRYIADIEHNGHCFTDGSGIISPFLAHLIAQEMRRGLLDNPVAFQFRLGGCKGVLAVWPLSGIDGLEVGVRRSQEKFQSKSRALEIVRCSAFSTATLNRQIILILESLGVPMASFYNLLERHIRVCEEAMTDNIVAIRALTKFVDENQSTLLLADLLSAGFHGSHAREPFVTNLLHLWRSWSLRGLKEKARISVEKSAFVLGCADESGTLRGHSSATEGSSSKEVDQLPQIFLQCTDPTSHNRRTIIQGVCIVGRNPSLHPGDIRLVQAVDKPQLRHLRDVVVFPSRGDRPVPSMLSGGDLDGDNFFVIWDPDLIPPEWNYPPMAHADSGSRQLNRNVNMDDVRDFFVKYMKSDFLPHIAVTHMAKADLYGPKSRECLRLANLHSKAVDYPKTGVPAEWDTKEQPQRWPHFMEKRNSYRSRKTLGVLYDKVVKHVVGFLPDWSYAFDGRISDRFPLDRDQVEAAAKIKAQYDESVSRLLYHYGLATEFELYTGWAMTRATVGSDYKQQEDLGREYKALKSRIRELCYEAAGGREPEQLEKFAAAMYKATEEEATQRRSESASGVVPDEAATERAAKRPLIGFPWIFPHELIRVAKGEHGSR